MTVGDSSSGDTTVMLKKYNNYHAGQGHLCRIFAYLSHLRYNLLAML